MAFRPPQGASWATLAPQNTGSDLTINGVMAGIGAGGYLNARFGVNALGNAGLFGHQNASFGDNSGAGVTSGNNQTFFGYGAGRYLAFGSDVTAIGRGAMGNTAYTLTGCTFLGAVSGASVDNLFESTAVGTGAIVSKSDQMALGSTTLTEIFVAGGDTCKFAWGTTPVIAHSAGTVNVADYNILLDRLKAMGITA